MLRQFIEWCEIRAAIIAVIVLRLSAIYWMAVAYEKSMFMHEPLTYNYSIQWHTQETVPVAAALLVQVISLAYQLLTRSVWGRAIDSIVLIDQSPKVAAFCLLVFPLWILGKPHPSASYVPLAALTAVSILVAVLARRGPLSRDSDRVRTKTALAAAGSNPQQVTRLRMPKRRFADIHGHQALKDRLLQAARFVLYHEKSKAPQPARNGILLHGEPGNGKTVFAEALAGELRLPLLTLSYSDVASKWVGEKTSRIREAFDEAARLQPCVLFLDEVDSLLESREVAGASAVKEDRDVVNALLTLLVDIRRSRVLVIAATNHLDRLDAAAIREGRFDFKIEVPSPDLEARIGLLRQAVKVSLPGARVPDALVESVARRWNGYSTKRILAVTEELPQVMIRAGRRTPEFQDFQDALRAVQGHAFIGLENVRPISELVLTDRTRLGLHNVLARMADPEHTERHGGTLPTGIVFYGPPGTGKTAAAKALAKELGWTFLPATGAELSRDVDALSRLYAKAKEQRPAIVFIDEADELLRHRQLSVDTQATNKLLTIMDGAADRVRDVVWIAATNHLDQVDGAMLRGGRFSEKVMFELPTVQALGEHLTAWVAARRIAFESGFEVGGLVEMMGEVSIANAEAVAQAAVNLAIGRGTPVVVSRRDVRDAMLLVLE